MNNLHIGKVDTMEVEVCEDIVTIALEGDKLRTTIYLDLDQAEKLQAYISVELQDYVSRRSVA